MKLLRNAFAAAGLLLLAACGSSDLIVLQPISSPARTDTLELVYDGASIPVPPEASAATQKFMEERFFSPGSIFHAGKGGLTIRYGYIGFKKGSRAGRYFLGPLVNSNAKMVLRATFFNANGEKIGEVQSTGEIGGGFFGGSANSAIKRSVNEIAAYAEHIYY